MNVSNDNVHETNHLFNRLDFPNVSKFGCSFKTKNFFSKNYVLKTDYLKKSEKYDNNFACHNETNSSNLFLS